MARIMIDFEWDDDDRKSECLDEWADELNDLLVEELAEVCSNFGISPDRIIYED